MKALIRIILLLFVVAIACLYIVVPSEVEVSAAVHTSAPVKAVHRYLSDGSKLTQWWGDIADSTDGVSGLASRPSIAYTDPNSIQLVMLSNGDSVYSRLNLVRISNDTSLIDWRMSLPAGVNPFKRLRAGLNASSLRKQIRLALQRMQLHLSKQEDIYGIPVRQIMVTDTILVSRRSFFDHEPSTPDIYQMIDGVKRYLDTKKVTQTNPPMLHIWKRDADKYEVMVAIPVNRNPGSEGDFVYKRMVPGKILVSEVRGDARKVDSAFARLENYVQDHGLVPPAIPFFSLVTNRQQVADSTTWITRIYYPIL